MGYKYLKDFALLRQDLKKSYNQNDSYYVLVNELAQLNAEDRDKISEISKKIRDIILEAEMPFEVVEAVTHTLSQLGYEHAYAVRFSATAEDLPYASFAGLQDTYLNITGKESILQHIRNLGFLVNGTCSHLQNKKRISTTAKWIY